ncbi:MAG TPA: sigma 54-interacting transcriptional regulator, partial [Labilithrix sp.]|nr:sigma 54-interacting transcriptional regulator [Labilithrix sp.]
MTSRTTLDAQLGRVGLQVASSLELDGVLGAITRGLVRDLGAAMARVWLIRREANDAWLQLAASAGLSERLDGTRSRVPLGELKIGEIAAKRQAVCTTDLADDPRFADQRWIRDHALTTFAGYPLLFGDELLGVLAMFSKDALTEEAFDKLGAFAAQASVAIKNAGVFGEVTERSRRLEAENSYLREELHDGGPGGIVGRSAALARVLTQVARVAPTMATVLLTGETGTGKELFARALHEQSARRGRFVRVNYSAIAPTLI